jgi:hypothetical protein
MNIRRFVLAAPLAAISTTLTLALAAEASERDRVGPASLRYCADPGDCGGNMLLGVSRAEATATPFTRTWASDWNRWAAAHTIPRQIVTAGCNYLASERYYLCAVRVRSDAPASSGTSCGLMVIKPGIEPDPSDQIEEGFKTAGRILYAFPQQIVP